MGYIKKESVETLVRDLRSGLHKEQFQTPAEFNLADAILLNVEQLVHLMPDEDVSENAYTQFVLRGGGYHCVHCGKIIQKSNGFKLCPYCGAKKGHHV